MLTPIYDKAKLKIYTADRGCCGMAVCTAYSKEEAVQMFVADGYWVHESDGVIITEHQITPGLIVCNLGDS